MKAIITTLPGKSVLQEVPMPEMNEDSVLIQLKYCGVCYSEHYEWKTNGGAFGHEAYGNFDECRTGQFLAGTSYFPGHYALVAHLDPLADHQQAFYEESC